MTAQNSETAQAPKRIQRTSPKKATYNQICDMRRDHTDVGDFCLMTDSYTVWLSERKMGEQPKQRIEMPRKTFNRLLVWYERESKPRG